MIDLDAVEVARAYARIAPALDLPPRASEAAIRIALREADHLVDDIYDVPAALVFALGRTPRCFAGFRTMSVLLVEWQTKRLGFRFEASPRELGEMLLRVAKREVTYEDVRSWAGGRLLPFGG